MPDSLEVLPRRVQETKNFGVTLCSLRLLITIAEASESCTTWKRKLVNLDHAYSVIIPSSPQSLIKHNLREDSIEKAEYLVIQCQYNQFRGGVKRLLPNGDMWRLSEFALVSMVEGLGKLRAAVEVGEHQTWLSEVNTVRPPDHKSHLDNHHTHTECYNSAVAAYHDILHSLLNVDLGVVHVQMQEVIESRIT